MLNLLFSLQEPRKWNTRTGNGTNSASSVANATPPLEPRASSHVRRKSIVLDATKKNTQLAASSARR